MKVSKIIGEDAEQGDRTAYVWQDRNSGLPSVRTNEGVLRARGGAIAFLFDVNVYERGFLEDTCRPAKTSRYAGRSRLQNAGSHPRSTGAMGWAGHPATQAHRLAHFFAPDEVQI